MMTERSRPAPGIDLRDIAREVDRFVDSTRLLTWIDDELERGAASPLGTSREGRTIAGWRFGSGPLRLSLVAGAHADEPVGPATLAALCIWLSREVARPWLNAATWTICPHIHPDGAMRNASWTRGGSFDLRTYLENVVRDVPGDDIEFGYPRHPDDANCRPENRAVAAFLQTGAPYGFHASLHGMALAEGAWFLIDRHSAGRSAELQADLRALTSRLGMSLHDQDRSGEKGFQRISRGFCTTPRSDAMRDHFLELGDATTAALFRPSSMEFVASLGGEPRQMVSEMPLFLVRPSPNDASRLGQHFLDAREALAGLRMSLASGDTASLRRFQKRFGLGAVSNRVASLLQLAMIFLGSGLADRQQIVVD